MTSAENQARYDERMPILCQLAGLATLGLSLEPLIGPIKLRLDECYSSKDCYLLEERLHWVIVGGESSNTGHNRKIRPMHPKWVRDLRDECVDARIAFFFKQWGDWGPEIVSRPTSRRCEWVTPDGSRYSPMAADAAGILDDDTPDVVSMVQAGKETTGNELDGRTWTQFPDSPQLEVTQCQSSAGSPP